MNHPINIQSLKQAMEAPEQAGKHKPEETSFLKKAERLMNKDFSFSAHKLSDKIKESFYLELASLMEAGLDIRTALQLIRDEQQQKKAKEILTVLLNKIINGSSLSAALREDRQFTAYEHFTIEIGEETGKLNVVLNQLSVFYKARIRQRRQIIGALTYPAIVMTVASCSVIFMMNYVVPMFSDVFKRFNGELPFLTRQVLHFSNFMQAASGKLLLAAAGAGIFLIRSRNKPWYRKYKDQILLKTPVIKNIITRIYLARFASTMQLLLSAKVPLLQALGLSKQIIGLSVLEQAISQMEADVMKGQPLHRSMAAHSVFPSKMVALVKVGEEVNELELFFKTLSERYSEELDFQTAQLGKFIEPLIIVVLGLVVGLVLIAMYLPMFGIGDTIQ